MCISIVGVKPWIDPDICATDIFYFKKIHICLQIFQGDVICVVVNGKHIQQAYIYMSTALASACSVTIYYTGSEFL